MPAQLTLTSTVVAYQLSPTETITNAKLNQGFNPTVTTSFAAGSTTGQVPYWNNSTVRWEMTTGVSVNADLYYLSASGSFQPLPAVPATTGTYLYLNQHYT